MRAFVATLEEWIIRTLASFNVRGERREDRIGVWVRRPDKGAGREDKIAAIGIRLKRWVSLHGVALNVDCDLSHFSGIVPCGVAEPRYGVTSLADLGVPVIDGGGRYGDACAIRGIVWRNDRESSRTMRCLSLSCCPSRRNRRNANRDTNSSGDRSHASPWRSADDGEDIADERKSSIFLVGIQTARETGS